MRTCMIVGGLAIFMTFTVAHVATIPLTGATASAMLDAIFYAPN